MKENMIIIQDNEENEGIYKTIIEFDRKQWEINRFLVDPHFINKESYDRLFLQPVFFTGQLNQKQVEGKIMCLQFYIFEEVHANIINRIRAKFPYEIEIGKKTIELKTEYKDQIYFFRSKLSEWAPDFFNTAYDISLRYREKTFLIKKEESFDIDNYIIGGIEASSIRLNSFFEDFNKKLGDITEIKKEIEYLTEIYVKVLKNEDSWLNKH